MNLIDRIPPDKCRHAIAGALIFLVSAGMAVLTHQPPVAMGMLAAALAGVLKEVSDHWLNARAIDAGLPAPHEVSPFDALATTLGACVPAIAALVGSIHP